MKNLNPLALSILSGLLLASSWPNILELTPLIFVAFIPLLFLIETRTIKNNFGYFFITFLIFNGICGFWVTYASLWGGIVAALVNATLMALVFQTYLYVKRNLTISLSNLMLISAWLGFEYFHNNWDLTWSWFNLGNVFASKIKWVQWYEYMGVQGGTLWVLFINLFLFGLIKHNGQSVAWKKLIPKLIAISLFIILPIVWSYSIFNNYNEVGEKANFVVVQPNYDAYTEKFTTPEQTQIFEMRELALKKLTDSTDFVLFPETALPKGLWVSEINEHRGILSLKNLTDSFPNTSVVVGASMFESYEAKHKPTLTAKLYNGKYYDSFNSAIHLNSNKPTEVYNKSKLVPGVEKLPFPMIFGFLENLAINLGGAAGSLGTQKERAVFKNGKVRIAPAICYESIYGEHMTGFVKKGANVLAIITNDGWWSDTPGYKQHWQYAKLRAVETRRAVARSANTGISGFINQKGEVLQQSKWDERTVLSETLVLNDKLTFYVQHGNYLYRIASFLAIILLLFSFVRSKKKQLDF